MIPRASDGLVDDRYYTSIQTNSYTSQFFFGVSRDPNICNEKIWHNNHL